MHSVHVLIACVLAVLVVAAIVFSSIAPREYSTHAIFAPQGTPKTPCEGLSGTALERCQVEKQNLPP